jgi:hypothetical protein
VISRSTKLMVAGFAFLALGRYGYVKVRDAALPAPPKHTTAFGHELLAALGRDGWSVGCENGDWSVYRTAAGRLLVIEPPCDWQGKSKGWGAKTKVLLGGQAVAVFSDDDLEQVGKQAHELALRLREQKVAQEQQDLKRALDDVNKEAKP